MAPRGIPNWETSGAAGDAPPRHNRINAKTNARDSGEIGHWCYKTAAPSRGDSWGPFPRDSRPKLHCPLLLWPDGPSLFHSSTPSLLHSSTSASSKFSPQCGAPRHSRRHTENFFTLFFCFVLFCFCPPQLLWKLRCSPITHAGTHTPHTALPQIWCSWEPFSSVLG